MTLVQPAADRDDLLQVKARRDLPTLGSERAHAVDARVCGSLVLFIQLLALPVDDVTRLQQAVTVCFSVGLAAVFLLAPQRVPRWVLTASTLLSTAGLVVGTVATAQTWTSNAGSLVFVLGVMHVGTLRSRGEAWLHLGWTAGIYAAAVTARIGTEALLHTGLPTVAILLLLTAAVTWCRGYVDDLIDRLEQQAEHDPLTGLLNRDGVRRRLAELQQRDPSASPEPRTAVLVIDVDHFKAVNDAHGHLAGDQVLVWLADQLRASFRNPLFAGRFGGEEFLVVLPGVDIPVARQRAEELRALVARRSVGNGMPLTVSIGVASGASSDILGTVLAEADAAVYVAKRNGRNRVEATPAATSAP